MSSAYFLLDGAYNEVSLYNSPDPVTNMKYPCIVSYPFLSDIPPTISEPLPTDYDNMNQTYAYKPCPYCPSKNQGT